MNIAALLFAVDSLINFPPAPPVVRMTTPPVISTTGSKAEPWLTTYRAGDPSCDVGLPRVVHREEPLPSAYMRYPNLQAAQALPPVSIRFRIDPSGRPVGIKLVDGAAPHGPDVIPAFAAWRFEKGQERASCELAFEKRESPVPQADLQSVYRWIALVDPRQLGGGEALRRAVFSRAIPDGSDCADRRPNIRQQVFPAFEQIPQAPGTISHSFMTFDIDAAGRPINVRLVGSGGNAELDRQSLDAVARSRFAPGERRGCPMWYYRTPTEPLEAPLGPSPESLAPPGSNCPTDDREPWAQLPPLVFPNEFRRRNIEGWAIVGYDLAPWGGVGNVQLLAAEPASPFGERALGVVRNGTKKESPNGYRGCTIRVRFEITDDGPGPEE
jgi:TonB family protein